MLMAAEAAMLDTEVDLKVPPHPAKQVWLRGVGENGVLQIPIPPPSRATGSRDGSKHDQSDTNVAAQLPRMRQQSILQLPARS